jgi:hypothetical protein
VTCWEVENSWIKYMWIKIVWSRVINVPRVAFFFFEGMFSKKKLRGNPRMVNFFYCVGEQILNIGQWMLISVYSNTMISPDIWSNFFSFFRCAECIKYRCCQLYTLDRNNNSQMDNPFVECIFGIITLDCIVVPVYTRWSVFARVKARI